MTGVVQSSKHELEPLTREAALDTVALAATLLFAHGQRQQHCWLNMSDHAVESLITNAIHTAFIKYPEGDGGPNLDYEWIAPDQSTHIAKAILQDLAAN